jgi:hypothetical protein
MKAGMPENGSGSPLYLWLISSHVIDPDFSSSVHLASISLIPLN